MGVSYEIKRSALDVQGAIQSRQEKDCQICRQCRERMGF